MQLKDWLESVGVVAIVASLVFVGLELQQSQEIALSQGNIDSLANRLALSSNINTNSDVWARGNAGAELEGAEIATYRNLVRDVNDSAFLNVQRLRRMDQNDAANVISADFAAFLFENPGALRTWTAREERLFRNRKILVPESLAAFPWLDEIQAHLDRLDVNEPRD